MELQIYDSALNELGIVDEFKSLIWTPRFYEVGSFELQAPMTENNIALLQKHRYIYRPDVEETAFIKSVSEATQDGEQLIVVSGAMLEGLLDKRTITGKGHSSSLRDTLKMYIEDIQGVYSFGYKGMSVEISDGDDCQNLGGESAVGQNLGEYARGLLRAENRAVKIKLYPEQKKMVCGFVSGTDRSTEQQANPHVIFSEENKNICNVNYSYSEEGCCSLAECWADYKDVAVDSSKAGMLKVALGGRDYSGGQYLDGLELTNWFGTEEAVIFEDTEVRQNEDGSVYTVIVKKIDYEATYEKLLAVCKQHYCPYTESFDGTLIGDGYRNEWQLGDYVTVEDARRGTFYKKQAEEVTEAFEASGKRVDVTLGASLKTVIDLIREAKK